ncbi:MAG: YcjX family protein [Stappiaceae bacterium]
MIKLTGLTDEARFALDNVAEAATSLTTPNIRLGVTGLARAGKTVFISALVHNLIHGGRLPLFESAASGRLARAYLKPQPDDAVPRFDYETHVAALVDERIWPSSTHQVAELRLTIEFESASYLARKLGSGRIHLDIVDYPGEWLLDLPLLGKDFRTWSQEALAQSHDSARAGLADNWHKRLNETDPLAEADEVIAKQLAAEFTDYLRACRADDRALSMLPPGRFLMPGDMAGSPALTFAPLSIDPSVRLPKNSLGALLERRFEAYKKHVIRPFFRDHFARLDRQIVLVDVMAALNAGPGALRDLEAALTEILQSFRPGKRSWLSSILTRRVDRLLFAATKADHLHQSGHDRLEQLLGRLVGRAIERASFAGAQVDVLALAAVRATREAMISRNGEKLPAILGTPLKGETVNGEKFDGESEIAMFPGDLPENSEALFGNGKPIDGYGAEGSDDFVDNPLRFVRFRPPRLEHTAEGMTLSLPHIRLDRALQFLIGDRLA